ncbi:MAG: 4Fe-4S dicluster domain-containing protein [Sphingomonadales bacterium]|nr:4Fe-4S dicluster domain-containing protein [Sphingomonadales bacterium]
MARKIPIWEPSDETKSAMAPIDGNEYCGVGESSVVRPKPFFWHDPALHPWGRMQQYTVQLMFGVPGEGDQVAQAFRAGADGISFEQRGPEAIPVADTKIEKTPQDWSENIRAFALANEADDIGIARLDPTWVFEGFEVNLPNIITIAVAHDYNEIKEVPSLPGSPRGIIEVGKQYTRGATVANRLRNYIRAQGYNADSYEGPMAAGLLMIPAAIAGGLGELGKHHSIIHPRFGSSFRLAAVATDMPLKLNEPIDFGADDFCLSCQICTDNCPPAAISDEKQIVRGVEKWHIDFDKCIPFFAEARGCAICIAVCPWSRPGVAKGLLQKIAKKRARSVGK